MKTLNIKADGSLHCMWGNNVVITTTSDTGIPSDTRKEIDELMAEIQKNGYQEIHFEYGLGRNFTHKASFENVEEISNTDNNVFATMETWAAPLVPVIVEDLPNDHKTNEEEITG